MARETTEPAAITAPLRSTDADRTGGPVVLSTVALTGGLPWSEVLADGGAYSGPGSEVSPGKGRNPT
ncbi:hypothetical protein GCM10010342_32880 [Streptomyces anulatus]|nr:hypothetical protein GCM10010342_32880 [Streptomyces anulatus]